MIDLDKIKEERLKINEKTKKEIDKARKSKNFVSHEEVKRRLGISIVENKNVEVKNEKVYALKYFKKGEIVIKYHLKLLSEKEFEKSSKIEKNYVHTHLRKRYLYASPERYVRHSTKPNTIQDLNKKCDIAKRTIKKGEEITTDATKDDI